VRFPAPAGPFPLLASVMALRLPLSVTLRAVLPAGDLAWWSANDRARGSSPAAPRESPCPVTECCG
jgi:hypothetical protein